MKEKNLRKELSKVLRPGLSEAHIHADLIRRYKELEARYKEIQQKESMESGESSESQQCNEEPESLDPLSELKKTLETSSVRKISKIADPDVAKRIEGIVEELDEPGIFLEKYREGISKCLDSDFMEKLFNLIQERFPGRENESKMLLMNFLQTFTGSRVRKSPLLVGPPGTGKSYFADVLTEALRELGIKAVIHRFCCSDSRIGAEQFDMQVFGTSAHYSNGSPSTLTTQAIKKDTQVIVVLVDEVEKGLPENLSSLLSLLDPQQPLQDTFLKEVFPHLEHDLRFKTIFILTANNQGPIEEIPELKDRLIFLPFREYHPNELVDIGVKISKKFFSDRLTCLDNGVKEQELRQVACEIVKNARSANEQLTLRTLLHLMEIKFLEKGYPFLKCHPGTITRSRKPRKIGFIAN